MRLIPQEYAHASSHSQSTRKRYGIVTFSSRVTIEDDRLVVFLGGELDMDAREEATRDWAFSQICDVTVDLSGLSFMDCSGFGALVAARQILRGKGGSLSIRNCSSNHPARLLSLLEHCHDEVVDRACVGGTRCG